MLLWVVVGLALLAAATLLLIPSQQDTSLPADQTRLRPGFGGPFTLTGADGKSFASSRLAGKPYAMFFGFTRCGDICPTTLGRLARLRKQADGEQAMQIVFVTIDPANDGPKEVGQYAEMFGAPIIGLTGTAPQIAQVKTQYGIHAAPNDHASGHGDMITHTSAVLLFGRDGTFAGTFSAQDSDVVALEKIKRLMV